MLNNAIATPVFLIQVEQCYAALMAHAPDSEAGLGGKLLYTDELNEQTRALMVAANIAGAASLAATADTNAQKQALREGVADFLVTDLDEALRILKNEIRKRQPAAVCVAAAPAAIAQEMRERGVVPDLAARAVLGQAAQAPAPSLLVWSAAAAPARWLPKLDALVMDLLMQADSATAPAPRAATARRWLEQAPRFLGRLAHNAHILRCDRALADHFADRVRQAVQAGQLPEDVRTGYAAANAEHLVTGTPGEGQVSQKKVTDE
jgi:hypothetical protein